MKKMLACMMVIVMIFASLATGSIVVADRCKGSRPEVKAEEPEESVTCEDSTLISKKIEANDLTQGATNVLLLYDANNMPTYLLGITETEYIIIERYSGTFCECGEGNPYEGHTDACLYYGGPMEYYSKIEVPTREQGVDERCLFYDITRGAVAYKVNSLIINKSRSQEDGNEPGGGTTSAQLSSSYSYIRRRAFGYNDDNTCSAVACGIALNYIYRKHGINVVASNCRSELVDSGVPYIEGHPDYYGAERVFVSLNYPKASTLHTKLVNLYGIGGPSFGPMISNGLNDYFEYLFPNEENRPTVSSAILPAYNTIKNNINSNIPVIVTTVSAGEYSMHTMVVYGYRTQDGTKQLLVHTGWYEQKMTKVSGSVAKYYQNTVYINHGYAAFGNYFTLPNN